MKASDLKNILEVPFSVEKSFSPITEYLYFNKNTIKATNLEIYLKATLNEDLPFNGCVLAEPLQKFLNSIDGSIDLTFNQVGNVLMILHGKKNKFSIPMEALDNFPITPETKYTDEFFISDCNITEELITNLERASTFMAKADSIFSGIFFKDNKIYSSNREIIYIGSQSQNFGDSKFIPKNLLKFIFKFKKQLMENSIFKFYKDGFILKFDTYTLYFPIMNEIKLPDFDGALSKFQEKIIIPVSKELKDSINRIEKFNPVFDFTINNKSISLSTDSIIEDIEMDVTFSNSENKFKCNSLYMKYIVDSCDTLILFNSPEQEDIKAFGMDNGEFRITSAIVI